MPNINTMVNEICEEVRPLVVNIERNHYPTTRNNYGEYLSFLSRIKGKALQQLTSIALIRAGASKQGVGAAIKIMFPEVFAKESPLDKILGL